MISSQELRDLHLFKGASANAVARLATALREIIYPAGQIILKEGADSEGLYIVAAGTAVVRKKIDDNTIKVVARLSRGEYFGEMSLIDKMPASAEVTAESDVRLFVLTRSDFSFLMSKAPTEALDHMTTLMSGMSNRLRQTTRELITLYQVARNVGVIESATELGEMVLDLMGSMLGDSTTIAYYHWNPFNDEYNQVLISGPHAKLLPPVIDDRTPIGSANGTSFYPDIINRSPLSGVQLPGGNLVVSRSDLGATPQALFIYFTEAPHVFEPGDRQVMETISAVLAPAFETARARDEEKVRRKYEEKKQRYA